MEINKKQIIEINIALKFLELYNEEKSLSIKYIREGDSDKREPDIICSDEYSIEITSFYDNQSQAKSYWEDIKGITNPYQKRNIKLEPEEQLVGAIGSKLTKLEQGLYGGVDQTRIFLLCYSESPLFDTNEANKIKSNYQPFRQDNFFTKYFFETWLMWRQGGDAYGILKLE
ncbi:MAG TPA: hypothetical protein PKI16_03305 [Candidatus Dojkabacteria bacterium]|nr:hypothetical protein [Candidatus Dojkabacteria bacterium]